MDSCIFYDCIEKNEYWHSVWLRTRFCSGRPLSSSFDLFRPLSTSFALFRPLSTKEDNLSATSHERKRITNDKVKRFSDIFSYVQHTISSKLELANGFFAHIPSKHFSSDIDLPILIWSHGVMHTCTVSAAIGTVENWHTVRPCNRLCSIVLFCPSFILFCPLWTSFRKRGRYLRRPPTSEIEVPITR